jgi:hypothetical protein
MRYRRLAARNTSANIGGKRPRSAPATDLAGPRQTATSRRAARATFRYFVHARNPDTPLIRPYLYELLVEQKSQRNQASDPVVDDFPLNTEKETPN